MIYLYSAIAIAAVLAVIGFVLHKRNPPKKTLLLDEKPGELSEAEKRRERSKQIWDEANLGDIVLVTLHGSHKQRAMAKAEVSPDDLATIVQAHIERYDRNDESHKGVVAQQWKSIAKRVRDNPTLFENMDASYYAILQEVAMWQPWEKLRLKESVVAEVPKRPGETLPTEFFERMFDVPKVVKATTTSLHLARE